MQQVQPYQLTALSSPELPSQAPSSQASQSE
jgi:hypothetical protein